MKKEKRILAVVLIICLLLPTLVRNIHKTAAADGEGFEITNSVVKINGVDLQNVNTVKNGDALELSIEWYISNQSQLQAEYVCTLDMNGIRVVDCENQTLYQDNKSAGTFDIKDGAIYIHLNDEFKTKSEIKGRISGDGIISVEDTDGALKKDTNLEFEGKVYPVTVDMVRPASILHVQKNKTEWNVKKDDKGDYVQSYVITLKAEYGSVSNISLTESFSPQLSGIHNIQMDNQAYADWNTLNSVLSGMTLKAGQSKSITYDMYVDAGVYDGTVPEGGWNKVEASYVNSMGEIITKEDTEWGLSFNKPVLRKSGELCPDNTVLWTLTIDTNIMSGEAVSDIQDIFTSFKDSKTGLDYLVQDSGSVPVPEKSRWRYDEKGNPIHLEYTYITRLTKAGIAAVGAISEVALGENRFTAQIGDRLYSSNNAAVTTHGIDKELWDITKTVTGYDENTQEIEWTVEVPVYEGINNLTVRDWHNGWTDGRHSISRIVVDKTEVVNNGMVTDGNNIIAADKYVETRNHDEVYESQIVFTDAYTTAKAGQSIVINYYTKVTDVSLYGRVYYNYVQAFMDDAIFDGKTVQSNIAWDIYMENNKLIKRTQDAYNEDECTMNYEVFVDISDLDMDSPVILTDILPAFSQIKEGSVRADLVGWRDQWYNWSTDTLFDVTADTSSEAQAVFTILNSDATRQRLAAWEYDIPKIHLTYTVQLTRFDQMYDMLESENDQTGKLVWSNAISGVHNNEPIGYGFTKTEIGVPSMGDKRAYYGTYNGEETVDAWGSYIVYEVIINRGRADLSSGSDRIECLDVLSGAGTLNRDTIKVYACDENGAERLLTADTDYNISFSQNETTYSLPDNMMLKLVYQVRVHAQRGEKFVVENSFKIQGIQQAAGSSNLSKSEVAIAASGILEGETGNLFLQKIWQDPVNGPTPLTGSTFKIVLQKVGSHSDGSMAFVDDEVFADNITVNDEGVVTIEKLKKDIVYALYETAADDGFERKTEPLYFIIAGTQTDNIKAIIGEELLKKIVYVDEENPINSYNYILTGDNNNTANIVYENKKAKTNLVISKIIKGYTPDAAYLDGTVFEVFQINGTLRTSAAAFKLKDFHFDEVKGAYILNNVNLEAGDYVIEETAPVAANSMVETTSSVNGVASGNSVSGQFTITADNNVVVAFTNAYTQDKGKLLITKEISGIEPADANVIGALQFKVTSGNETKYAALSDFAYDAATKKYSLELPLAIGSYTVEESVYRIDGYTEKVTYSVNGAQAVSGNVTEIEIKKDETTAVAFLDSYTKTTEPTKKGILVITKEISGIFDRELLEKTLLFKVINNETMEEIPYTLEDFQCDAGKWLYTLSLSLGAGSYTIEESVTDIDGYTTGYVMAAVNGNKTDGNRVSVHVAGDDTNIVEFSDLYIKKLPDTGKLVIIKKVYGPVENAKAEENLRFEVTNKNTNVVNTYSLKDFIYDPSENKYILELDKSRGAYIVEESAADIEGYVLDRVICLVSDQPPIAFGAAVPDPPSMVFGAASSRAASDIRRAEVSVDGNDENVVEFEDFYSPAKGRLVITKTVEGPVTKEEAEGALVFTVKNNDTGIVNTYTLKEHFNCNSATGQYTLTLDGEAGSYTVAETVYDIAGHVVKSVTYAVNGAAQVKGSSANVKVLDGTTTVDFKDIYADQKTPAGDENDDDDDDDDDDEEYSAIEETKAEEATITIPEASAQQSIEPEVMAEAERAPEPGEAAAMGQEMAPEVDVANQNLEVPDTGDDTLTFLRIYVVLLLMSLFGLGRMNNKKGRTHNVK